MIKVINNITIGLLKNFIFSKYARINLNGITDEVEYDYENNNYRIYSIVDELSVRIYFRNSDGFSRSKLIMDFDHDMNVLFYDEIDHIHCAAKVNPDTIIDNKIWDLLFDNPDEHKAEQTGIEAMILKYSEGFLSEYMYCLAIPFGSKDGGLYNLNGKCFQIELQKNHALFKSNKGDTILSVGATTKSDYIVNIFNENNVDIVINNDHNLVRINLITVNYIIDQLHQEYFFNKEADEEENIDEDNIWYDSMENIAAYVVKRNDEILCYFEKNISGIKAKHFIMNYLKYKGIADFKNEYEFLSSYIILSYGNEITNDTVSFVFYIKKK